MYKALDPALMNSLPTSWLNTELYHRLPAALSGQRGCRPLFIFSSGPGCVLAKFSTMSSECGDY